MTSAKVEMPTQAQLSGNNQQCQKMLGYSKEQKCLRTLRTMITGTTGIKSNYINLKT